MAMRAMGGAVSPDLAALMQKAEHTHDIALAHVAILTLGIPQDYPAKDSCNREAGKILLRSLNKLSGRNQPGDKEVKQSEEDEQGTG